MSLQPEYLDKKNKADKIIEQYTKYSVGAGFIPVPIMDTLTIGSLQFTMIRALSKLYNIDFREHRVKSINAALLGSIGTVSGFKFFPGVGLALGIISTSVVGAASTYALGQVFAQHFDQGGTLLDFDPKASREFFKQELEKGKSFILGQNNHNTSQKVTFQELLAESQNQKASLLNLQKTLSQIIKQKAK